MAKKITDYDYTLPIIEDLIAGKTTDNQLLIRGINLENQIKGDYFVQLLIVNYWHLLWLQN